MRIEDAAIQEIESEVDQKKTEKEVVRKKTEKEVGQGIGGTTANLETTKDVKLLVYFKYVPWSRGIEGSTADHKSINFLRKSGQLFINLVQDKINKIILKIFVAFFLVQIGSKGNATDDDLLAGIIRIWQR